MNAAPDLEEIGVLVGLLISELLHTGTTMTRVLELIQNARLAGGDDDGT